MKKTILIILGFFLACYLTVEKSSYTKNMITQKPKSLVQKEVSLFEKSDSLWTSESKVHKRFKNQQKNFAKAFKKATAKPNKKTTIKKNANALKQKKKKEDEKKKLAKKKEEEKKKAEAKKIADAKAAKEKKEKEDAKELETLKREVRTYVTGIAAIDEDDANNDKNLSAWLNKIFPNYNKETNKEFFQAFQAGDISVGDFHTITQQMLDHSTQEYQEDAVSFLMQTISLKSFEKLVIHSKKDSTSDELKKTIINFYTSDYVRLDRMNILRSGLLSKNDDVVVVSANLLKESIGTNMLSARGRNVGVENSEVFLNLFNYLENISESVENEIALAEIRILMDVLANNLNISIASVE